MVSFRRDKKTQTWTVIGPASQVQIGQVEATRRDGTTSVVQVAKVSRTFDSKGVPTRFGYLSSQRWKYAKNADTRPTEGASSTFTDGLYS